MAFRPAALILRFGFAVTVLDGSSASPFDAAHLLRCASPMRFRAAALILRRLGFVGSGVGEAVCAGPPGSRARSSAICVSIWSLCCSKPTMAAVMISFASFVGMLAFRTIYGSAFCPFRVDSRRASGVAADAPAQLTIVNLGGLPYDSKGFRATEPYSECGMKIGAVFFEIITFTAALLIGPFQSFGQTPRPFTTDTSDGGPVVLSEYAHLNKDSTLHRSLHTINDSTCPVQLAKAGVR